MSAVTYTATRKIHADHTQSELVTDGDFSGAGSAWTSTGWTDTTNADHNTGNTNALSQSVTLTEGWDYVLVFTVGGRTAGSVTASVGGTDGTLIDADETDITETITAGAGSTLAFTPTSDFDGYIDDVSLQVSNIWSMDINASQLTESWPIIKNDQISLDGTQETIFHRQDQVWNFTSELITKANLTAGYWYEFLASVYGGESFTFDPYGTVASPDNAITVVMVGQPTITRQGGVGFFRVSFQVREL